jgi:hypothetical protein
MDELRFHSQHSPRNENTINPLVSPLRNGSRLPQQMPIHDPRANLPRRFTTDSGRVPTLSSLTSPQRLPDPSQDFHVCCTQDQWIPHLYIEGAFLGRDASPLRDT